MESEFRQRIAEVRAEKAARRCAEIMAAMEIKHLELTAVVTLNGVTKEVRVRISTGSPLGKELLPHMQEEINIRIREGDFRVTKEEADPRD